jgi:hypothetical protein
MGLMVAMRQMQTWWSATSRLDSQMHDYELCQSADYHVRVVVALQPKAQKTRMFEQGPTLPCGWQPLNDSCRLDCHGEAVAH